MCVLLVFLYVVLLVRKVLSLVFFFCSGVMCFLMVLMFFCSGLCSVFRC